MGRQLQRALDLEMARPYAIFNWNTRRDKRMEIEALYSKEFDFLIMQCVLIFILHLHFLFPIISVNYMHQR